MTITATSNGDGTYTVTCGTESIIVGSGSSSATSPKPGDKDGGPTFWPASGATATIIARRPHNREIIDVGSGDLLPAAIRNAYEKAALEPKVFEFRVAGETAVDLGGLSRILTELGEPEWFGAEVKLVGKRRG